MEGNGTAYIDSTNISTQAYLLIVGMVLILIVLSYSLYFSLKQNNKKINILSITIVATMIALIAPLIVLFTIKPTLHNLFSEDGSSPYFTSWLLTIKNTTISPSVLFSSYQFTQNGIIVISFLGGLGIVSTGLMCYSMFSAVNGKLTKIFKTKIQKFLFWVVGLISVALITFILFGFFLSPLCESHPQNAEATIQIFTFSNFWTYVIDFYSIVPVS